MRKITPKLNSDFSLEMWRLMELEGDKVGILKVIRAKADLCYFDADSSVLVN